MLKLIYLLLVFISVILVLLVKRPLYQAVLCGLLICCLLFQIPVSRIFQIIIDTSVSWSCISVVFSLYLITLLQHILDRKKQISLAQKDLDELFHNRRINATIAPIFIGLLPHAGAMILCSDIVKEATDDYLKPEEQAFVTNWFRHIPESTLPTYTGVLLMTSLSGVPLSRFIPCMIVPIFLLFLIGYLPYLRKIPAKETACGNPSFRSFLHLLKHLWSLLLVLFLILVFRLSVVSSLLLVIILCFFVYRFSFCEFLQVAKESFVLRLLANSFLVLLLKEFITYTSVLSLLPDLLEKLPIPSYLLFALLFFFATIISGTTAAIALGAPLAFASGNGDLALAVLLMGMCHGASQLSPIHVCLSVASDCFHIPLFSLIRKSLPSVLLFALAMLAYYHILLLF